MNSAYGIVALMGVPLLSLVFVATSAGAEIGSDQEPPVAGRPPFFNGAAGIFRVATEASPTKLQAEAPLRLTVRVTSVGEVRRAPRRPRLAEWPRFAEQFYCKDLAPDEGRQLDDDTWEFAYELKPRRADVREIPAWPFVYFRAGILPAHKGYQTLYADPIPLTVEPRETVRPGDVQGPTRPIRAPDETFRVTTGPAVLRRAPPWTLPGPAVLVTMAVAPPLGCLLWYLVWRRRYPDAAKVARRRQSAAARRALRALRSRGDDPPRRGAAAVAGYLRDRAGLRAAEPTPEEVADCLRRASLPESLIEPSAKFFASCDAARFDPDPSARARDLTEAAAALVNALEEQWPEPSS